MLQLLDIGGDMDRLDAPEGGNPLPFAPAQKHGGGASIGGAGVAVTDIDGEEVAEAVAAPCPALAISAGSCFELLFFLLRRSGMWGSLNGRAVTSLFIRRPRG